MRRKERRLELLLYAAIFLIALFLRIYKLGILPYGIHIDEAGMGYDAYSIAHWGLDRYYKFYPVYFLNYGGGQSVLYGYLCAVLMKFFEPSAVILRIPAVCFGILTWIFGSLITREILGRKAGLLGSVLLAICPCFILHSRLGMDCYLFLGASTVSLYCCVRAVNEDTNKNRTLLYGAAGLGFGISLYTYALSWLAVPIFLIFLLVYLLYIRKINWKQILCMGVPLGILAAPLILMVAINTFQLPEIVTGRFTIPRLTEFRGAEISLKHVINNIPVLIQAYFFHDQFPYNSLPTYFTLYLISVPFAMVGIGKSVVRTIDTVKERQFFTPALILLWFLAQTCMGLVIKEPNVNKLNGVFFSLAFLAVYGIRECYSSIQKGYWKKYFVTGISALYVIFFLSFGTYYFTEYTEDTFPLPYFDGTTYADILDEWEETIGDRDVYVDSLYIYYPLGEKLSPIEFQLIEQGLEKRGKIHFGLPEEQDENGFYLIFREENYADQLKESGFQMEEAGMYKVLYK